MLTPFASGVVVCLLLVGPTASSTRLAPGPSRPSVSSSATSSQASGGMLVLASGTTGSVVSVVPRSATGSSGAGVLCYDDSSSPPLAGAFAAGDEIVDWGVKSCGLTDLVRVVTVAYASTAVDPQRGGPGAALTVALYQGTQGGGILGSQIARLSFTGLPAADAQGLPVVHLLAIDFGVHPLLILDGHVGYGFTSDDGLTQPLLTLAPDARLGTLDALDRFSPGPATAGNFAGTFDLGPGMPYGSLYLQLAEDPGDVQASSMQVNGTGVNPLVYSDDAPPVGGRSWITRVDLSGFPQALLTVQIVTLAAVPPTLTAFGELLVDITDPSALYSVSYGLHGIPVPRDLFLYGGTFHTQAAVFQTGLLPQLTNGIDAIPGF